MSINSIAFTISQLLQNNQFILVEQLQKRKYVDGKPTDDTYTVAVVTTPQSGFEKIAVKLDCEPLPISNDEIKSRNSGLNFVWVTFTGDSAKFYNDFKTGTQKVSAHAKSISLYHDDLDEVVEL